MYKNLQPEEFEKRITSDPRAVVIDVRTAAEYNSGHLEGALNLSNIREDHLQLDTEKHYYVHCRVGGRSAIASQFLVSKGFKFVYNLNGKLEDLSLPMVKSTVMSK